MEVNELLDSLYAMYDHYRKINPLIAIGISKAINQIKYLEKVGK